jgi:hypothetical protein
MNPDLTIEEHIMKPARLEKLMIKDHPVVPPDSIIKTFTHLKGRDVDFVLTQDKEGLSTGSFILRNGEWARFFLETWYDPIYRSYNFQKAETHALVSETLSRNGNNPASVARSRASKAITNRSSIVLTGAHRPVAPDYSIPTIHHPSEHVQLIQFRREGPGVQVW